jgi:hypothetical protein
VAAVGAIVVVKEVRRAVLVKWVVGHGGLLGVPWLRLEYVVEGVSLSRHGFGCCCGLRELE